MLKFEIGQKVVVTQVGISFDRNGMGSNVPWYNSWNRSMDHLVGKTLTVAQPCCGCFPEDGISFEETDYMLPANILTPVFIH